MKSLLIFLLLLGSSIFAQENLEVYIMDVSFEGDKAHISNLENISNNPGYDSQPSFISNSKLLFAGTENNQTEIQVYDLNLHSKQRLNTSTIGSEYSPQKFPVSKQVAAVRLDTNGLQRLYGYDYSIPSQKEPEMLLPNTEIAYFAFHDDKRIIASVLGANKINLVIANLKTKEVTNYIENAGRSIHNIPDSNSVSYTLTNEDKNMDVYLLDIDEDGESFFVCQLPTGIQDHCWLSNSKLLVGSGSKLFMYDMFGAQEWKEIADLSKYNISEINRITVSPNGKKIALVATDTQRPPSQIVDAHIKPFNERNLDAFANAFSEDVMVGHFQKDTTNVGRASLKSGYERFYKRIKNSHVEVLDRIVLGNFVIDHEKATTNGEVEKQATVYTVKEDLISSMFFIPDTKTKEDPTQIVDLQLKAYNNRDIAAFAATYSDDVVLKNYPNKISSQGVEKLKTSYGSFFKNTPDLHCQIISRISIGNKVIDKEVVTMNGQKFEALALYEIKNGKIVSVTFFRY